MGRPPYEYEVNVPPDADVVNFQLQLRVFDKAPVVQNHVKSAPNIKKGDVLVSLNGMSLRNVKGGIPEIKRLLRGTHSDGKIILHRIQGGKTKDCTFIDQDTNTRCVNGKSSGPMVRGNCGNWLCPKHRGAANEQNAPLLLCQFIDSEAATTCSVVIDSATRETCANYAMMNGKCGSHGGRATCCFVIDSATGETCPKVVFKGDKCGSHGGRAACSFVIDSATGETCPKIAVKGGKCGSHGGTCSFVIDSATGETCPKRVFMGGRCSSHGGRAPCSFVIDSATGETCPNQVLTGDKCGSHGGRAACSFVIDSATGETCPKIAVKGGKCWSHGDRATCSFVIDSVTGETCPNQVRTNQVQTGGWCWSHGDIATCSFRDFSSETRCIRYGNNGGVCVGCSTQGEECRVEGCGGVAIFGGLCKTHDAKSPSTIVLDHMEKRLTVLERSMSEEQYKIVSLLHRVRKQLRDDNMQDEESFSLHKIIADLCVELTGKHLTDKKYKGQQVIDEKRENWISLDLYVHQRLMRSLKCPLKDYCLEYDYKDILPPEMVRKIIFEIDAALEKENEKWTYVPKVGSSGNVQSRIRDCKTYSSRVFNPDRTVRLNVSLTKAQRSAAERLAISYLSGHGYCGNVNTVVTEVPSSENSDDPSLYMMFSKFQTPPVHFAEDGLHHHGLVLPPGYEAVRVSDSTPANVMQQMPQVSQQPASMNELEELLAPAEKGVEEFKDSEDFCNDDDFIHDCFEFEDSQDNQMNDDGAAGERGLTALIGGVNGELSEQPKIISSPKQFNPEQSHVKGKGIRLSSPVQSHANGEASFNCLPTDVLKHITEFLRESDTLACVSVITSSPHSFGVRSLALASVILRSSDRRMSSPVSVKRAAPGDDEAKNDNSFVGVFSTVRKRARSSYNYYISKGVNIIVGAASCVIGSATAASSTLDSKLQERCVAQCVYLNPEVYVLT